MKGSMKTLLLGACAAVIAFGGMVTSASALEIVFAISAAPGSTQYVTAEEFTRRANELLGDKAQVVFYGSGQLGDDKDLMQKLKLGTVHLSMPSSIMSTSRCRSHLQEGAVASITSGEPSFARPVSRLVYGSAR